MLLGHVTADRVIEMKSLIDIPSQYHRLMTHQESNVYKFGGIVVLSSVCSMACILPHRLATCSILPAQIYSVMSFSSPPLLPSLHTPLPLLLPFFPPFLSPFSLLPFSSPSLVLPSSPPSPLPLSLTFSLHPRSLACHPTAAPTHSSIIKEQIQGPYQYTRTMHRKTIKDADPYI